MIEEVIVGILCQEDSGLMGMIAIGFRATLDLVVFVNIHDCQSH
jgi:hypothetical protein